MQKYFRSSIFVAVLVLMIIGVGQSGTRAALDRPINSACRDACEAQNLECFFGAVTKSDERKCTAQYRRSIAHCK